MVECEEMLNGEPFRLVFPQGCDGEKLALKPVAEELFLLIVAGMAQCFGGKALLSNEVNSHNSAVWPGRERLNVSGSRINFAVESA